MPEPADSLVEFFTADHRRCDTSWVDVEKAAESGASDDIAIAWQRFDREMRRHFDMEELVLFPAFETATGVTSGPTEVMRQEHAQMRGLLDQMQTAVGDDDYDELVDLGDTLMLLIQQHNQKEENMLYPMSERALAPEWAELQQKLLAVG